VYLITALQFEKERDILKQTIASLEVDLESKGKEVDGEKKKLEELTRERDILTKLRSQVGGWGGGGQGVGWGAVTLHDAVTSRQHCQHATS
jgi:hypothetical protein